jgi:hypothetical protein
MSPGIGTILQRPDEYDPDLMQRAGSKNNMI